MITLPWTVCSTDFVCGQLWLPILCFRRFFICIRRDSMSQQRGHLGQKGLVVNLGRAFKTLLIWHMQICLLTTTENPQLWLLCITLPFPWSSDHGTKLKCKHSEHNSAEAMEVVWIWLVTATAPRPGVHECLLPSFPGGNKKLSPNPPDTLMPIGMSLPRILLSTLSQAWF